MRADTAHNDDAHTPGSPDGAPAQHGEDPRSLRDFRRIADAAAIEGLLRCWVRETGVAVPVQGPLVLDLAASGTRIEADVLYRSPAGFHRFDGVRLGTGAAVNAVTLASLLVTEATAGRTNDPEVIADLVERVADSERRVTRHLAERSASPDSGVSGTTPFLQAEQALVLGHPLHPTPKSRVGLSEAEAARYSPELRGSFQVHWFAADRSVVTATDEAGKLLEGLAPETPTGTVAVPVHPWQAREVRSRPGVRELFDAGLLHDLGPSGPSWFPTASVRTLYHPDAPVMLKLSLGLPITNSKRENLRKELRRGVEIDQLLDAGLAGELADEHPGFGIVRDPAWLAVDPAPSAEGNGESGLDAVLRANPFGAHDRALCVAGLLAERPDEGVSTIVRVVDELSVRTGRTSQDIAEEWCARYFDQVIAPVLWLYRTYGLGLEAHQQNTVVVLDESGWPSGGWYRDNQGYYISEQRSGELRRFLPEVGVVGDNLVEDDVIDERLGYYIGINNLIGLVGAFGASGLADEAPLFALLRERLAPFADLTVARTLAQAPTLRCKGNLLTRVDGLDELVGPLETQSVYCDITNPIAMTGTPA